MFLKKIKIFFKEVGVKITLWYLALMMLTLSCVFYLFYFLYSQSLLNADRKIMLEKFKIYEGVYLEGGKNFLDKYIKSNSFYDSKNDFFVRISDQQAKTIYFYPPLPSKIYNLEEIENGLKSNGKLNHDKWIYIKTLRNEDDIEVLSLGLKNGEILQVGLRVNDRDELLDRFEELYSIILIVTICLGGFGGFFLSNRILKPVRILIETLQKINRGSDKLRLPKNENTDELATLTNQFNIMLDHVEKTNESMRTTLDIVAHEMRTPLTSFRAMAEVALTKPQDQEKMKEVIQDLIEGVDEILSEFKIMMEITEMELGVKNLNLEMTNINRICHEVIDLYEMVAEQKEIKLDLISQVSLNVLCDHRKIRQALANLLDNAIKYSPPNTTIKIKYFERKHDIYLQVIDQGRGIPEDEIPLIFKRLYRAENSRNEIGIGLGLSLVKSIMLAHKGRVEVVSTLGMETIFSLILQKN